MKSLVCHFVFGAYVCLQQENKTNGDAMYIVTSDPHHREIIKNAHAERAKAFRRFFGLRHLAARTAKNGKVVTA